MSTTTPAIEHERENETASGSGGRRADSTRDPPDRASRTAPFTFDPSRTRRVRDCIDEANDALPDAR